MPLKVKDNSYSNYLSVIMEFQYAGKKYLFTGDAWSEQILMSIESEKYEMVKLPHHGSARNISEDWKDKIACKNFMICTDGNGHPDKQTLAKLLKWYDEVNIYCSVNWWSSRLFFGEDKQYSSKLLFKDGEESEWN
jgi:beta-lactamase superfamily II metal-dependent hydrolase